MSRHYFTFGQSHAHRVDGITFDCDSVVEIEAPDAGQARDLMVEKFGRVWSMQYTEDNMNMDYFPRGIVKRWKIGDVR